MIMNMVGGSGEVKPSYKVYGFQIDMSDDSKLYSVSYPKTIFGQLNGASFIETPAFGAAEGCLNDWEGCPLISGIKRQTGNPTKGWTDVADKRAAISGSSEDQVVTFVPTWFMRVEQAGSIMLVAFSQTQLDSQWKDYSGSVGSERKGFFRVGCFNSRSDGKSYAGSTWLSGDTSTAISKVQSLGEGADIWTKHHCFYLMALAILLYKSVDLFNQLAHGATGNMQTDQQDTIYTNDYGIAGTLTNYTTQMSFFWIRDFWNTGGQLLGGVWLTSDYRILGTNGYMSSQESDFVDDLVEAPTFSTTSPTGGAVRRMKGTTEAPFFPVEFTDADTTKTQFYTNSVYQKFGTSYNKQYHFLRIGPNGIFPPDGSPLYLLNVYYTTTPSTKIRMVYR